MVWGSIVSSAISSVAGSLIKSGGKKKGSSGASSEQPFSSFMSGDMDLEDFGGISNVETLTEDNSESEPAEVSPMWNWLNAISGIDVDAVDSKLKKDDDA